MTLDWSAAYREHYPSLVRFLYRRVGELERAEDIAQEAFLRALRHRPDRPRAWLFTVALRLLADEGRRDAVRRKHLTLLRTESQARPAAPAPDTAAERGETAARVRAALARLSERDRDALLLWEEGFSYDEIAEHLGLARGSVGTTLARARTRFVQAYDAIAGRDDAAPGAAEEV